MLLDVVSAMKSDLMGSQSKASQKRRAGARRLRSLSAFVVGLAAVCAVIVSIGVFGEAGRAWLCFGVATKCSIGARVTRQAAPADAIQLEEALKVVMEDPEKFKEAQETVNALMEDPDRRREVEDVSALLKESVQKLKDNPDLSGFISDISENGAAALEKYKGDEKVMKAIAEMQDDVRTASIADQAARELDEELIQEVFDRFDQDKDRILSLDEFNSFQLTTEGPASVLDSTRLEAWLLSMNPALKEPSRGMPFADFRRLYVDRQMKKDYGTDIVKDHMKVFGAYGLKDDMFTPVVD